MYWLRDLKDLGVAHTGLTKASPLSDGGPLQAAFLSGNAAAAVPAFALPPRRKYGSHLVTRLSHIHSG